MLLSSTSPLDAAATSAATHKCFSTAIMTSRWLQRDFGIYIVNMFDTGQAARVLQLPGLGLKYLLQHFCGVQVTTLNTLTS